MSDNIKPTKHSFIRLGELLTIYYCRFCHVKTELSHEEFARFNNDDYNVECPSCGQITINEYIKDVGRRKLTDCIFFNGMNFFDNGDKIRIFLNYKEVHLFNNKLQQIHFHTMIVINIKTGQSYLFEPHYSDNNKLWKHYIGPRIINISMYSDHVKLPRMSLDDIRDLIVLLQQKLREKLGYNVRSFEKYYDDHLKNQRIIIGSNPIDFGLIVKYVRQPNINPFLLDNLVAACRIFFQENKHYKYLRKLKHDSPSPIQDLISIFGAKPVRSLNKLIAKKPACVILIPIFKNFKDINNFCQLLEWADSINVKNWYQSNRDERKKLISFLDLLLTMMPEKILTQKLLKCKHIATLYDASSMYCTIIKENPEYKIDTRMSINEMHDVFTLDFNKLIHKNKVIKYTEKEKKLESFIDGYNFALPKDTLELVIVGTKMKICVGSYGIKAYTKDLTIVIAYKGNEPVICLELKNKRINQAKIYRNFYPKNEELEAISQWIKLKDLISNTSDLSALTDGCTDETDDYDNPFHPRGPRVAAHF